MTCRTCEHARQAGKRKQTAIVGCTVLTKNESAVMLYQGGNAYEGWLCNTRRPGDERETGEPGQWLGVLCRGVLVEARGQCQHYKKAETIIETKDLAHEHE